MINKFSFIAILLFLSCALFCSGCGSLYIGTRTHTHIYGMERAESDDPNVNRLMRIVKMIQGTDIDESEPLKGFTWDDKKITKYADKIVEE